MRKLAILASFLSVVILVFSIINPVWAAPEDAFVGDVAIVSWLEGDTVKVALVNETNSRKSITVASAGHDLTRRPYFLERTIVVPARSVTIEAFNLSSTWRGEPLKVEAKAWDRYTVVDVQTSELFKPESYLVRAQEELQIIVNLDFLLDDKGLGALTVDEYYQGLHRLERGSILIRSVDGGFEYFPQRNRVEFVSPKMLLTMYAPALRSDVSAFSFSVYQEDAKYQYAFRKEIPGPTILVYGHNLLYRDNSHLNQAPSPSWDWQLNN